jgi:hypothetical protein
VQELGGREKGRKGGKEGGRRGGRREGLAPGDDGAQRCVQRAGRGWDAGLGRATTGEERAAEGKEGLGREHLGLGWAAESLRLLRGAPWASEHPGANSALPEAL